MFTVALFTIAKIWKQPKCLPVDEWIKQLGDIYAMEYYQTIKKKILPFATAWMDLQNIMLSEISQSEKDKHHRISLICGNKEQTELRSKIETDSQIVSRMTAIGECQGVVGSSKREKGFMEVENSVVIAGNRREGFKW